MIGVREERISFGGRGPFATERVWLHNCGVQLPPAGTSEASAGSVAEPRGRVARKGKKGAAQVLGSAGLKREAYGDEDLVGKNWSVVAQRWPEGVLREVVHGIEQMMVQWRQELQVRPWHEDPLWMEELSDSVPFKEVLHYDFVEPGHINVNEGRSKKTMSKICASRQTDSKHLCMLDSRTCIGSGAKGRSGSPAMNKLLRGEMSLDVGFGVQKAFLHAWTHLNRADGPTRGGKVKPPGRPKPAWLEDLEMSRFERFDICLKSDVYKKGIARWMRFPLGPGNRSANASQQSMAAPSPRFSLPRDARRSSSFDAALM